MDHQIDSIKRVLESLRHQCEMSSKELDEAKAVLRSVQRNFDDQRKAMTAIERKIARCNLKNDRLTQESQSLQEKEEEGNPFAVTTCLLNAKHIVLADLINTC